MTPEQRIARLEHLAEIMFEDEIRNRGNRRARHIWDAIHRERLDRAVEVWEAAQPPTSNRAMLWAKVEGRMRELKYVSLTPRDVVRNIASMALAVKSDNLDDLLTIMAYAMAALEQAGAGESP